MTKIINLEKQFGKGHEIIFGIYPHDGITECLIHYIFPENKFGVRIMGYQIKDKLIVSDLQTNNPTSKKERLATTKAIINMSPIVFEQLKRNNIFQIEGSTNNAIANLVKKRLGAEVEKMKKRSTLREAIIQKKVAQGKKKPTTRVKIRI
ncbi:MAG TPA: hypothetical protein PKK60_01015 [archaeon]|nr:hypothetical protein [archaeon]